MKRNILRAVAMLAAVISAGCQKVSHNALTVVDGRGLSLFNAGIQYYSGLAVIDVSRENSRIKIKRHGDDSVETGIATKGEIEIEKEIGKQITGYLTDLSPEVAAEWIKDANANEARHLASKDGE